MRYTSLSTSSVIFLALVCGCSSDEDSGSGNGSASGGADSTVVPSSGGADGTSQLATGGAGANPGSGGGSSALGGNSATGGLASGGAPPSTGVGGTANGAGGAANGAGGTGNGARGTGNVQTTGGTGPIGGTQAVATGGLAAVGGADTTPDTSGTGGSITVGGAQGLGGSDATGGQQTGGGDGESGGTAESGGQGETGGANPSGGIDDPGGASQSGGMGGADGGNESGGSETGGSEPGGSGVGAVECGTVATPGQVITFNDDGGWCWYQDERVIVDPEANKLIIGSVAIGGNRNGNIEVTMYDLDGMGTPQRNTLGDLNPDDHNTAALLKTGEGKYVAVYTTHNDDCYSYYNLYENGAWGQQKSFNWSGHGCPTDNGKTVSYSNLWHMGDQLYNFVRSTETSPNLLTSTDGNSWSYSGRLTSTERVGYVAGYYKYWGNHTDRIDFVGTEAHPRDNDNSLYHGYVKDGKVYNSTGTEIDGNLLDANAQNITTYTKLFATGSRLGNVTLTHLWNCDLMRYPDGTIVLIFTGRANGDTNDPDKRFGYARFDGSTWKSTYLVNAGHKLYDSEQDYTGLGAIHPNNPNTIYISTTYDPRDDTTTFAKHEIWRGTTCDGGQTFDWTPITQNSTLDNLRPIVPYWDSDKTVLLWMKGTYHSAQTYDTDVVGVILDGV